MTAPTSQDFARAKRIMAELWKNLDKVEESALKYFRQVCPFASHALHVLPEGNKKFGVFVFYRNTRDIAAYLDNGVAQKIEVFIFSELERQGRGRKGEIEVRFEFDSDENVRANYEGNYFLRLK